MHKQPWYLWHPPSLLTHLVSVSFSHIHQPVLYWDVALDNGYGLVGGEVSQVLEQYSSTKKRHSYRVYMTPLWECVLCITTTMHILTDFNVSIVASPSVLVDQPCEDLREYSIEVEKEKENDNNDDQTINDKQPKVGHRLNVVAACYCWCWSCRHCRNERKELQQLIFSHDAYGNVPGSNAAKQSPNMVMRRGWRPFQIILDPYTQLMLCFLIIHFTHSSRDHDHQEIKVVFTSLVNTSHLPMQLLSLGVMLSSLVCVVLRLYL